MPIRVLLVEDSPVALAVLTKILQRSSEIEIVGAARTGTEALSLIPQTQPQVVCTDLHMPQMDGLTLTTEIMTRFPLPILVVSVSVQPHATQKVFELLAAGAVDVFPKPMAGLSDQNLVDNAALIEKIKILAGVKVFRRRRSHQSTALASLQTQSSSAIPISEASHLDAKRPPSKSPDSKSSDSKSPDSNSPASESLVAESLANEHSGSDTFSSERPPRTHQITKPRKRTKIIAIGASTGGPQALHNVLSQLPRTMPPIICVQHISKGFLQGLLQWMQTDCSLKLEIARPGQQLYRGHVYFSPENHHLRINSRSRCVVDSDPPIDGHRPSVTAAFSSVAQQYGEQAIGVLLTGMGRDGAAGLAAIARTGGWTLAQDEATSVVFGMPKAAIDMGAVSQVLPIESIAPTLIRTISKQSEKPLHRQKAPTL